MKLVKLNVEIPQIVVEMENYIQDMIHKEIQKRGRSINNQIEVKTDEDKMKKLQQHYCFAGGAFSNLYIHQLGSHSIKGNVINDVDIYVDYAFFEESYIENIPGVENIQTEDHRSSGYAINNWDTIREITRFNYKGLRFQVISLYHVERLWYFDFRFRNFYYKNGEVFASEGALQDIENKELVVASFGTPLSTLIRGFKFEYELGFSLSDVSKQMLLYCLKHFKTDLRRVSELTEHITKYSVARDYVNETMQKLLDGNTGSITLYGGVSVPVLNSDKVVYPFHEQSEFILECYNPSIGEDNYQALVQYKKNEFLDKEISVGDFNYKYFLSFFEDNKTYLQDMIRVIGFVQLAKDFTNADFDKAEELFKIEKIELSKHREQIDNVIIALRDSKSCPEADILIPQRFKQHIYSVLKYKWSVTITHDVEDTLGSLYGEKLILNISSNIQIGNVTKSLATGKFELLQVQDGCYVLSNTEANSSYFYKRGVRKQLFLALQKELGKFRLGEKGDIATIRNFGKEGHWFQKISSDKAVLSRFQ
ncbi:hypothetical protein [Bacillus cereus group sp. TH152-1LC]|uniref:hypothetical protein n=1 Tax=Bacillus cereus group sp. TH152-1LC TaxID=3018060 RepID=UPI0022E7028B|nr:hypothetical protein [Bacillus cereus group sp. TH152-1LC]MDA1675695.1 hypothetical protein [Bacillus cereus group sp. TH152-1LC]